ncbi:hypothetical protein [Dendronalium phyllosphericum]|uniref:hypothetical protein n=1 Tax=Dendronalium phyllosphericum TaxID=2840445 RepID=UPI001CEDAAED|nr:hypothetical protein [Dendronalium phyllosphericum]
MFSLSDLKQTRFYREAFEEGRKEAFEEGKREGYLEVKLEAVPRLLALDLGLTVEQIAQALDLEIEQVRQAAQRSAGKA